MNEIKPGVDDMDSKDQFDVPKDMRSMAEAGFEQARKAFESFISTAQQTASALEGQGTAARAGAKEVSTRAVSFAEKNVAASLDYAEKLMQTKDLAEILRLHTEYVQNQMRTLAEQASELGQAVAKAAMDSSKPK